MSHSDLMLLTLLMPAKKADKRCKCPECVTKQAAKARHHKGCHCGRCDTFGRNLFGALAGALVAVLMAAAIIVVLINSIRVQSTAWGAQGANGCVYDGQGVCR